jgi:hypothetical protein
MSAALTCIYTERRREYAGQMTDDDDRVQVQARVKRSSAARLDEIAAAHEGWTRSEALRYLLALGLQAHDHPTTPRIQRQHGAPSRATPAHGPAVIDAATHAKLQRKYRP